MLVLDSYFAAMFTMFDPPWETGASYSRQQMNYSLQRSGFNNYEPNLAESDTLDQTELGHLATAGRHSHVAPPKGTFESANAHSSLGDAAPLNRQAALQDPAVVRADMHAASCPLHCPPNDMDLEAIGYPQYLDSPSPEECLLQRISPETSGGQDPDHEPAPKKQRLAEAGTGTRKKSARRARNGYKPVSGDENSDSEGDRKRERFLERNRAAATRSRRKKKDLEGILEARARELSASNSRLSASLMSLQGEIFELKSECLRHTNCNCEAIRNYMTRDIATLNSPQYESYNGRSCWACEGQLDNDSLCCNACGSASTMLKSNTDAVILEPVEEVSQWRQDVAGEYWRNMGSEGQPG